MADTKVSALSANTDPQTTDRMLLIDKNGAVYTSEYIELQELPFVYEMSSPTENSLVRWDNSGSYDGAKVDDCGVIVDDSDNMSGVLQLTCTSIKTSAPVVITDAATYTVLAANSGRLHVIPDMAQNCNISLPAEAAGLNYEFIYGGAATEAHDHTLDSGSDTNYFVGGVSFMDTANAISSVYSDGDSNSKLTVSNIQVGSSVKIHCDGTLWYINGTVVSDTTPAFADQ